MNIRYYLLCIMSIFSSLWLQGQELSSQQLQSAQIMPMRNRPGFTASMNIGLKSEDRKIVIETLRQLLADNYVLYTKSLNFHWNVEGELFSQLHKFFKKIYKALEKNNDLFAERIRALGGYSPASLQEFLSMTQLSENNGGSRNYKNMLQILLKDFETVIRALRDAAQLSADYNDWGTNNMIAGLLESMEKMAWMIRAHLR